jgi:hypothetical protein
MKLVNSLVKQNIELIYIEADGKRKNHCVLIINAIQYIYIENISLKLKLHSATSHT